MNRLDLIKKSNPSIILAYRAPVSLEELKDYTEKEIIEGAQHLLRGDDMKKRISISFKDAVKVLTFPEPYDLVKAVKDDNRYMVEYILDNKQVRIIDLEVAIEYAQTQEIKRMIEDYKKEYDFGSPFSSIHILTKEGLDFMRESLGDYTEELFPPRDIPYITEKNFISLIEIIYRMHEDNKDYVTRVYEPFTDSYVGRRRIPKEFLVGNVKEALDAVNAMFPPRKLFRSFSFNYILTSKLLPIFTYIPEYMTRSEKKYAKQYIEEHQNPYIQELFFADVE